MYMAGIQEIDEYPRVLSDSVMLPHNYRVVKTYEEEDRIDRFVNWVRSKIGFEKLNPRVIYSLERKDQAQKNPNEQVVLAGDEAPERPARRFRSRAHNETEPAEAKDAKTTDVETVEAHKAGVKAEGTHASETKPDEKNDAKPEPAETEKTAKSTAEKPGDNNLITNNPADKNTTADNTDNTDTPEHHSA